MFRLMPKVSALVAVQRHTAASTSVKPWVSEQQGNVGGESPTQANQHIRKISGYLWGRMQACGDVLVLGWCTWDFCGGDQLEEEEVEGEEEGS